MIDAIIADKTGEYLPDLLVQLEDGANLAHYTDSA
jgi:hypothetical protein